MSADLRNVASLIDAFDATIVEWPDGELGGHALAYAHNGWPVLPLHPWDCRCRSFGGCGQVAKQRGKRPCTSHGVIDATTDLNVVAAWWERWPTANIGLRVPAGVVVVDIDPRNDGGITWAALHERVAEVPTRSAVSGRGDGGRHLYYGHPGGQIAKSLGVGLDVKASGGYVVAPPSRHAETGNPYRWVDVTAPIVALPAHLVRILRPAERAGTRTTTRHFEGESVADWYSAHSTWPQILEPHGWAVVSGDGDSDGSVWRHPTATNATSATVRHGCLFVYSPNTRFDTTEANDPHGYTRFRAFAILDHRSDLAAAARAAAALRDAA